jgi:hypothetical protein
MNTTIHQEYAYIQSAFSAYMYIGLNLQEIQVQYSKEPKILVQKTALRF